MIFEDHSSSPGDVVIHYGTKGMRWGVRKPHPTYSHEQQQIDRKSFGKGGVRRINKRLKRGRSHENAVRTEKHVRTAKRVILAGYGLMVAANLLGTFGPHLASSVAARAAAKRGEAAVLGIGMWKPIVAKSSGGVFKITTMK